MAEPGEFTKRAFLNQKMDLIQAEAVAELIASQSSAGVKNSLAQLKGSLSKKIKTIRSAIIHTSAYLELDLDFTEEDLNIITPPQILGEVHNTLIAIDEILGTYRQGKILSKGIDVLITGKPNVGKSSLMNALIGENRVIVSATPGTTRDIIHEQTIIKNTMVRFLDSAGIRLTDSSIEAEGVERAREQFDIADIILMLIDVSEPMTHEDSNLLKSLLQTYPEKTIIIKNKIDLGVNEKTDENLKTVENITISVSAKKKTNIEKIKTEIISKSGAGFQEQQTGSMLTNRRQFEQLKAAREDMEKATTTIKQGLGYEFAAMDLRSAAEHLSEITGEISTDDILNSIFADFCIGK